MDYSDDKTTLGSLRRRFYDQRKELELLDDCIGEALAKRAVPVTIALSAATYLGIRRGFLKNNGIFGLMRKNAICMCVGIGASLIGIRNDYYDKLAIFYSSHRYQELKNMILADWRQKKNETDTVKHFVQPNHLNLDLERPYFDGIEMYGSKEIQQNKSNYVTYEELQRKNREGYAIKHTAYY